MWQILEKSIKSQKFRFYLYIDIHTLIKIRVIIEKRKKKRIICIFHNNKPPKKG